MRGSFILKLVSVAVLQGFVASAVSSQPALQFAQSANEVPAVPSLKNVSVPDDKSKAECALRVTEFVGELDKVFDTERSVFPVQQLFKKYFPLIGCDAEKVLEICRKSRYFGSFSRQADIFIISFDGQSHSKLNVQLDLDRRSGNSNPPFVIIRYF